MFSSVICVCPTMPGREEWLVKAIACFGAQTYENRRMIIVIDAGMAVSGLIAHDERITAVACRNSMVPATAGEKRNVGCDAAAGAEIVFHWDDDDFYASDRIADQVGRLESSGRAVTGYHSILFTDGSAWWKYQGRPDWAFDASLCYRRSFWERNRFPEINDGLEARFRRAAIQSGEFVSVDAGERMYATIHPHNTSRRVIGHGWTEVPAPVSLLQTSAGSQ